MNILLLVGLAIFFGTFGGKIFQKLKIPQVVGYIIIGVLFGESLLGIWSHEIIDSFRPVVSLALGIIGFMIGSELKLDVFKKYGHKIYAILLGEGLSAFLVVSVCVTLLTGKVYLGILLGALASATAPAATVDVLWEYKTRGPLTTTLLAIVALDDGLALILYGFASVFAKSMIMHESFSLLRSLIVPFSEIGGSFLLGGVAGYGLYKLLGYIKDKERVLPFTLGMIIITAGVCRLLALDLILSSMVLGAVVANLAPIDSRQVFDEVKKFSPPIYVLFFVLVGARLDINLFLKLSVVGLALVYVVSRTAGKVFGAAFGGFISKAKPAVTKYMGLCLFSQAGVAIGLAISIHHNFHLLGPAGDAVGLLIINVVTATTFIVQIVGPPCVKFAVKRAGECWRDVTEEDIIDSFKVDDVMLKNFPIIHGNFTLPEVMKVIKESEFYHYPVVDRENKLLGLISLGELRTAFGESHLDQLIFAEDIAVFPRRTVLRGQPLKDAVNIFRRHDVDFLAVADDKNPEKLAGVLPYHHLIKTINGELLTRRQESEEGETRRR